MIEHLKSIIATLIRPGPEVDSFLGFDPAEQICKDFAEDLDVARALNGAFLIVLAGKTHPSFARAKRLLNHMSKKTEWSPAVTFYLKGIDLIHDEIEGACKEDPDFAHRLKTLSRWLAQNQGPLRNQETAESMWAVFFPEGFGVQAHRNELIDALREKRTVTVTTLNTSPITDPGRQILFTSNVLLTLPARSKSLHELPVSPHLREQLVQISHEPQLHWYDHPIQIGVDPEKNEVLYGLRGLDAALEFERGRGNMPPNARATCVLSVSVTHQGLQGMAKRYLEEEFRRSAGLKNLDLYVFTEADTRLIRDDILAPAAAHYLDRSDAKEHLAVFGVDGEYGRHYSFLKAIAPFWGILVQPETRATFKIDLDQVFPQKELVEQTGSSAFEHFMTPLWGAQGLDSSGQPVELGMIAGALVNEADIGTSLFTPDVPFPNRALAPDEFLFYSTLPQALSTEAEMTTRYHTDKLDGRTACIQRIHVTGGTNGILVDSLRRYRPFTPSFIGRAEDQAYILSTLPHPDTKLAYVHKDGLIMRHDKEAFAQEAIEAASTAKLVGDYIRILFFSAYARVRAGDIAIIKDIIDPFTGCFVSRIPITVAYLRFAFKAASLFVEGQSDQELKFIRLGAQRITAALDFMNGENSKLADQYEKERLGWNLYYDTLSAIEHGIAVSHGFALDLRNKAQRIIRECAIDLS
jgi:hypothetical protein